MGMRILFVDDERSILRSIERLFFDSECEVYTAESGKEGLELLARQPIDIVISDMRMPEMNGHQFLKKVKELYPETTRLMLSGYADEKEIMKSLIDGSNSLYLFKPWDGEEFKKKVMQIFEARALYRSQPLLVVINRLDNLALVTGVYDSVCRLIDQEAEITTIAKVIETDPAVTASVLRIVNSAFYNIKTASVTQAITFLGLPTVKAIVLSCSLFRSLNVNIPPFSGAGLIQHASMANAFMIQIYTNLLKKKIPESLSSAGLLLNIGLVMCLHYMPDEFTSVIKEYSTQQDGDSFSKIEKRKLGFTHTELGGYLLHWWGLPYPIVECALFYNEPFHCAVTNQEAVCVAHLANYYAWKGMEKNIRDGLDERAFDILQINKSIFER